jgi:hypothetical protein
MKMFLVSFVDWDGNNLDLFVQARTPEEARMLWVSYYHLPPEEDAKLDKEGKIFEVPQIEPGDAKAVSWGDVLRYLN